MGLTMCSQDDDVGVCLFVEEDMFYLRLVCKGKQSISTSGLAFLAPLKVSNRFK